MTREDSLVRVGVGECEPELNLCYLSRVMLPYPWFRPRI